VAAPTAYRRTRAIRARTLASAASVCFATTMSCGSPTDVGGPGPPTSGISRVSVVLDPSSISVSPGGTTQSIGTIRGATKTALSAVIGAPNNVTVRVSSIATTDSVLTKKYIVFANTAAVPGQYVLTVRVTAGGESDVEAYLTLTVTAP
jgi:hypothetical protein